MNRRAVMGVLAGVAGVFVMSAIVPAQVPAPAPPAPPAPAPAPAAVRREAVPAKGIVVQKAVVRPALPAPPVAVRVAPMLDEEALVEQFTQQYRPILRAELHRARTVCQLSEDQRRAIGQDGEWIIKDAAQRSVEVQQRMVRGARVATSFPDIQKHILEGFARAINAHLTDEQAAQYRLEVASLEEERKTSAIDYLIAQLDQALILSANQRARLAETLSSRWNEPWARTLEQTRFVQNAVPEIPDPVVSPILDSTQQELWRALPKYKNVYFNTGVFFNNMEVLEELPEVAEKEAVGKDKPEPTKRQGYNGR
jgi:hypothetical protein